MSLTLFSGAVSQPSKTKYNRLYQLIVETVNGNTIEIKLPFTVEIDITRNILNSANVCSVRIYNLSKENRNQIYFNQSDYSAANFRSFAIKAGYGDPKTPLGNLSTIFFGNITQAWSVREGVNFVTQIESLDGSRSFVNDYFTGNFPSGTPVVNVIEAMMKSLTGVTIGAIGSFPNTLKRDQAFSGNPYSMLFEITGGSFFIDNGKAYAVRTTEYVPIESNESVPTIQVESGTGLLNTPILERTIGRFEMLFEPTLNPGRLAQVSSTTFPQLNGAYKINSVRHRGIISPVVSGNLITIAEFDRSQKQNPITPTPTVNQ